MTKQTHLTPFELFREGVCGLIVFLSMTIIFIALRLIF